MGTYNNNNSKKFRKNRPKKRTAAKVNTPKRKSTGTSYLSRTSFGNTSFFFRITEIYDKMKPYLKLLGTGFGIFLLLTVYFGWFDTSRDDETLYKSKITEKYKVVDYFETVDPKNIEKVTLSYTILLDNPYTEQTQMENITSYLRAKYINDANEKDKKVMQIKAKIYKRTLLYERNYLPSDSYVYDLAGAKGTTETLEQKKPNYKKYSDTLYYKELKLPVQEQIVDELTGEVISEEQEGTKLEGEEYYKLLTLLEYYALLESTNRAATFYTYYDLKIRPDSAIGKQVVAETLAYIKQYEDLNEQVEFLETKESLWKMYKDNYPKKYQKLRKYHLNDTL